MASGFCCAAAVLLWLFYFHSRTPRNERNAIIQHGTMRRSLLERIGWAEWCITKTRNWACDL